MPKDTIILDALDKISVVATDATSAATAINQRLDPTNARDQRNHKILRQLVNTFWIEGVFKHSLYNASLNDRKRGKRAARVDRCPWNLTLRTPMQPDQSVPPETQLIDIFDQQEQRLLILGEPGSGKTTMLLTLAHALLQRAAADPTHPTPVVFNLSSWPIEQRPIAEWLAEELFQKYYVSKQVAYDWIENDALLLLLDGLDEIDPTQREKCANALLAFRKQHIRVPMAVCSHRADYTMLRQQLKLRHALLLQPLTLAQIDGHFAQIGGDYAAIRSLIQRDPAWYQLAQSPLMLSLMAIAYRGVDIELLAQQSIESGRKHLLDLYIQRIFEPGNSEQLYPRRETVRWLAWLARRMLQYRQAIFLIDRLQPDWLQHRSHIRLYRLLFGLAFGLLFGLVFGLLVGLMIGLVLEPSVAVLGGLVFGLLGGLSDIVPTEQLEFSWQVDHEKLILGLWLGLVVGLLGGVIFGPIFGISGGLALGLSSGLLKNTETTPHICSNQGVWQSVRNMWIGGLNFGLNFGLLGGLLFGLMVTLLGEPQGGLRFGLLFGILGGLFGGFFGYGGLACTQHITLRILLRLFNHAPLNYTRFLNYATNRHLLHKVGGGYTFVHRLLLEHFAQLTEEDIKDI